MRLYQDGTRIAPVLGDLGKVEGRFSGGAEGI